MSGAPDPDREAHRRERRLSVLGVIDLRGGRAVHAIAGRRAAYQPLRIAPSPDADPVRLAEHYRALGAAGLYIADLDRIVDRSDASQPAVEQLRELGLPIWIDQGIESLADWPGLNGAVARGRGRTTWIVGTETLRSLGDLRQIAERQIGERRGLSLAVSLDLCGGRVISACRELTEREPLAVARRIADEGIERLIVLDVARVGTAAGPSTAPLCRHLRQALPHMTIVSGGGVRGAADAADLIAAGCDWILAGTWLHRAVPAGLTDRHAGS